MVLCGVLMTKHVLCAHGGCLAFSLTNIVALHHDCAGILLIYLLRLPLAVCLAFEREIFPKLTEGDLVAQQRETS